MKNTNGTKVSTTKLRTSRSSCLPENTRVGTIPATNWPSYRRKPVGGFTFEVQQIPDEYLSRGIVVKTLSWSVIIRANQREQAKIRERGQIGLSRQATAHPTDGVLDAA